MATESVDVLYVFSLYHLYLFETLSRWNKHAREVKKKHVYTFLGFIWCFTVIIHVVSVNEKSDFGLMSSFSFFIFKCSLLLHFPRRGNSIPTLSLSTDFVGGIFFVREVTGVDVGALRVFTYKYGLNWGINTWLCLLHTLTFWIHPLIKRWTLIDNEGEDPPPFSARNWLRLWRKFSLLGNYHNCIKRFIQLDMDC